MRNFRQFLTEEEMSGEEKIAMMQKVNAIVQKKGGHSKSLTWSMSGGEIHIGCEFYISDEMLDSNGEFLVPLGSCSKLIISTDNLKSFKNFPKRVGVKQSFGSGDAMRFQGECVVDTLENFPKLSYGNLGLWMLKRISFSRCNKFIEEVNGDISLRESYVGPLLSFLLIKNLKRVDISKVGSSRSTCRADDLLNLHLRGDRDIIECKEQMLSEGLKEYAKL